MKGVTNQPLTIWVAAEWYTHPKILELMSAGHHVKKLELDGDLILAPQAHFFTNQMLDYLPAALTAARARRRKK